MHRPGEEARIAHAADAVDSDDDENNFEAFFDEEGDDIMAEIILRMYEMETGRGATGSKRRRSKDLVERLRRSEESKRLEAEKLARVAVAKAQKPEKSSASGRGKKRLVVGRCRKVGRGVISNGTRGNYGGAPKKAPEAASTVYNKNDGRRVVER